MHVALYNFNSWDSSLNKQKFFLLTSCLGYYVLACDSQSESSSVLNHELDTLADCVHSFCMYIFDNFSIDSDTWTGKNTLLDSLIHT